VVLEEKSKDITQSRHEFWNYLSRILRKKRSEGDGIASGENSFGSTGPGKESMGKISGASWSLKSKMR
jgi:hypothetical protein